MAFKDCGNDPGYLPAAFQGLTFYVESAQLTVNPGSATAEFPYRAAPASIDTAKKADEYSLSGWITGPDIKAKVLAFRAAALLPQPYVLIHPTMGPLIAGGKTIKFDEDYIKESGVCKFSFEGFEWGSLPDSGFNFGGGLFFAAVSGLISIAASAFMSRYRPLSVVPYAREPVRLAYDRIIANVHQATASAGLPTSIVPTVTSWRDAAAAWPAISEPLIDFDVVTSAGYKAMKQLVKNLGVSIPIGPAQEPLDALHQSPRLLALIAMGNAALAQDYLTPGEVWDAQQSVIVPLEAERRAASMRGDYDMVKAIEEYRRSFTTMMTQELSSKAPIVTHLFPQVTNSIFVAHELYGDASRYGEIERLNPHLLPSKMIGNLYALAR